MNIGEIEIYELKKNVVLTSLLALKGHWVLAESLYETIKAEGASPELIDSIIEMFEIAVDSVKDEGNRERIRQTLDSLSIIKEKERLEREKEENEAIIVLENY